MWFVPFVDREDLRVAAVLLDGPVLEEAGTAVDLDRGRADLKRLVAAVRLDEGDEQVDWPW
jgi:hypothetical protein